MRVAFIVPDLTIFEPKGLMCLSAVLRRAGHETDLFLLRRAGEEQRLRAWQPALAAAGATTGWHRWYLAAFTRLKTGLPGVTTVLGGPHATFCPECISHPALDVICRGEGEGPLLALVQSVAAGTTPEIPGLWRTVDGAVQRYPHSEPVADLATLPWPDRDLVYARDAFLRANPLKTFNAARGCLFKCAYCHNANAEFPAPPLRYRGVTDLLAEIRDVRARFGCGFVRFDDDLFTGNRAWLRAFAAAYPREVGLPFHCAVRADMADEETVALLRAAGCHSLQLGVESGDETLRREVLNKTVSDDQLLAAADRLRAAGIRFITDNITGFPGETRAQAWRTVQLNARLRPGYAWCTLYQPYPGTPLAQQAQALGLFDGNYDALPTDYYHGSILRFSPADMRWLMNLQKTLALAARFPVLQPLIRALLPLPVTPLLTVLYRLWYGWTHMFLFPQRLSPAHFMKYVARFLRKDRS